MTSVAGSSLRWPQPAPTVTTSATPRSTRTLVETRDTNSYVALVEGRGQARGEIGMACFNTRTSNLILCQFSDTQTYHRVIAKLNIFRPYQILMPTTCCERTGTPSQLYHQLKAEVSNVEIVPILRKAFSEGQGFQKVKKLVVEKFASVIQIVTQKYYCLAAAAALIKYIEVTQSVIFHPNSMKVEFQGSENSCMIDSITAQHLELLQNNQQPVSPHSVMGLISHCKTPGGSRLLRMNILQPPCDIKLIQQRLDCVSELIENNQVLNTLQDILARIPIDFEHVISTLIQIPKSDQSRILEQRINFVIALKHTLDLLPVLKDTLAPTQNPVFQQMCQDFRKPVFQQILEKVTKVINEEVHVQRGQINMRRQRCFAIKPDVNPILDVARKAYCDIVDDINEYVAELSRRYDLPLRLGENIRRGYYIQLILPGQGGEHIPNLPDIFLQISKFRNILSFTTEFLISYDHRCREVIKEIDNLSAIVVTDLVTTIREDISSLYVVSENISELDILYALARYSMITLRCIRPQFSKSVTAICNGRHPLLEVVKNEAQVPNNTLLSEDINFHLITGPNMSGKTTYLKQVAILQILAQLGAYVPADSATFRITSNIFSRIGTSDSMEDNASSFAVEMSEMKYILDNINDNSLVIIDELGRGTSVEEGTAISMALAEELTKTKSFILFATHYLFLTRLESMYANVLNFTMETQEWRRKPQTAGTPAMGRDDESEIENPLEKFKLKYTHSLKRGVTDVENYGLKLATSSSFPPHVVKNALEIAEKINRDRQASASARQNAESMSADEESSAASTSAKSKAYYLLGVQLKIASEMCNNVSEEVIRDYLETLQLEFKTAFQPGFVAPIRSATATSTDNDGTSCSPQSSQGANESLGSSPHEMESLGSSQHENDSLRSSQHEDESLGCFQNENETLGSSQHENSSLGSSQHEGESRGSSQHEGESLGSSRHENDSLGGSQHENDRLGSSQLENESLRSSQNENESRPSGSTGLEGDQKDDSSGNAGSENL